MTCHTCRSPDTILQKETRLFFIQCETCGSRRSVASIKSGFQAITQKRAQLKSKQQWSLMLTIYYCENWTVAFIWFADLALKTMMKKGILCLHYRYSMKAKIVKRPSTDVLKNISIVFNENWTCHLNTKKDNFPLLFLAVISTVDLYQVMVLSELELKVDKIPQVSPNKLPLSQLFLQDKIANLIHKPNKKWYCM